MYMLTESKSTPNKDDMQIVEISRGFDIFSLMRTAEIIKSSISEHFAPVCWEPHCVGHWMISQPYYDMVTGKDIQFVIKRF